MELEQLTVYGSDTCADTQRSLNLLDDLRIHYRYVNVDQNAEAEQMIAGWNHGHAKTPTLVFGLGESPRLIEPSNEELQRALVERGLVEKGLRGQGDHDNGFRLR